MTISFPTQQQTAQHKARLLVSSAHDHRFAAFVRAASRAKRALSNLFRLAAMDSRRSAPTPSRASPPFHSLLHIGVQFDAGTPVIRAHFPCDAGGCEESRPPSAPPRSRSPAGAGRAPVAPRSRPPTAATTGRGRPWPPLATVRGAALLWSDVTAMRRSDTRPET